MINFNQYSSTLYVCRNDGVEVQVVDRFQYDNKVIEWADIIISAGGDGTFLLAASKVRDTEKPVMGINTDPKRFVDLYSIVCIKHRLYL